MSRILSTFYTILPDSFKPFAASLYRRYLSLTFPSYVRTVHLNDGAAFRFKIADLVAKAWYGSGSLSPAFRRMIQLAQPGDHVIEVGSHQGYSTLCLSLTVGVRGQVYAFEPDLYCYRRLVDNLKLNKITNVVAYRQAAGTMSGQVSFVKGAVDPAKSQQRRNIVEQVSLDHLLSTQPVHMIKVDVEGYECQVLEGAREILAQRPKLMIEVHLNRLADYGHSVEDLMQLLDSESYWWLVQKGESEEAYIASDPRYVQVKSDKIQLYGVPGEEIHCFQRLIRSTNGVKIQ